VDHVAADANDLVSGVELISTAVEVLGGQAELDDIRRISPSLLATLFPPEPEQGLVVLAHDDPGIGAANEMATVAHGIGCSVNFTHSSALHRIGVSAHLNASNRIV
jgi:hypothetical protein